MKLRFAFSLVLLLCFGSTSLQAAALRVFIRAGVKTHGPNQHDHPRFLADWKKLLNERGLQADGSMKFPTAEQLENTDVVVVFAADGMKIVGEDRNNFEKFLRRGGGLVVLHDGVVAGDQHEWAKKVQGGSWLWAKDAPGKTPTKWYEGEVGVYFTDTTHPITKGISNFDWKDEIYYELDMAPDVKVLATSFQSVFIIAPQLWTYEKTWEGGSTPYRAFVSIPGHEYASFNTPHYRAIIMRGIAWAGKRDNVDEFCKPEELASLTYPEGGPTAPNKEAEKLVVHPEFNISLVASEPLIEKAISLDWDQKGRLWVAETPEYPSGRTVNQNDQVIANWAREKSVTIENGKVVRPARDRVSWLEDTDGDGIMDKKHVFYEGLELVTSLVFYKDGVIVAQAPDILWIRDTNGDGVGDKVEKLFTGFGTRDTHAVINNFRWGMDGWVYGAVGYSGGQPTSESADFGKIASAIFRFKPDGKAFEVLASTACNTWGFDFGWDNEMYYSTPTCGDHALHIALPERILARGSVGNIKAQNAMQDHNRVKPAMQHKRQAYVQIDVVGGFTAASGACLYNGGAWPQRFDNTFFVSEPTVNLVHQDFLSPSGASYVASKEPTRLESEFLAGRDPWFRPVHARVGPDGALYVLDFYNQAVVHNDTRGPKHGANNAATRPDRDHHLARILRVQHKEAKTLSKAKLDSGNPRDLVAALEHPNGWTRMTAQRLLFERGDSSASTPANRVTAARGNAQPRVEPGTASVIPALSALLQKSASPAARLHALWALNNLGKLDETLTLTALQDKDPAVRKNALRAVGERSTKSSQGERAAIEADLKDSDARVKLQALVALQSFPPDAGLAKSIIAIWPSLTDKYLQSAALGVTVNEPALFLEAALADKSADTLLQHVVKQLALKGDANQVARVIIALGKSSDDTQKQLVLQALVENLKPTVTPAWNADLQAGFKALLSSKDPAVPGAALPLVARWDKSGAFRNEIKPMINSLSTKLGDASLKDEQRAQVVASLLGVRQFDSSVIPAVAKLLAPGNPPDLQKRVIEALGATPEPGVGQELVTAFPGLSSTLRESAFAQLVKRSDWSLNLLQAVADKKIDLLTLGPASVHRLRTHSDRSVAQRAEKVITALRGPAQQEKDKLIAEYLPVVSKPGNLENGKKMFNQNCLVCHTFKNEGRNVAPDLTGMGLHGAHDLLVHILDPNRVVEPNYVSVSIETKDNDSYEGTISSENSSFVRMRNATGDLEIRQDNIKSRRSTGRSLMPEGFEALGAETMRDVISYISADVGRYRIIDLSSVYNASTTRGIYMEKERLNDTVNLKSFGLVKADEVPFDLLSPTRAATGNNLLVLKSTSGSTGTYQQKVEVPVPNISMDRIHILGGIGGWAWPFGGTNTKGTPVAKITALHADGAVDSWTLTNGVHIVDHNNASLECPGSKKISGLVTSGQVRLISQDLKSKSPVTKLTLESFNNTVAPTFIAITAETAPAESHK